jgi:hypothetical protein
MKISRPSPSLVISILALVVACAGTATAAGILITNSSQVKAGAINGSDIKNRSITGPDIANNSIGKRQLDDGSVSSDKLSSTVRRSLSSQGFIATEAVRKAGPENQPAGQHKVATMEQLQPGTYAIFAKTILTPTAGDLGVLGELLKLTKTAGGHCILDAGGDVDDARAPIATPYAETPTTLNMQMTRTIDNPSDITLTCDAPIGWRASDTSIIALKLAGSSRVDTTQ